MVDRAGESADRVGELQRQNSPTLSPDGRKLAVEVEEGDPDLWVYDLERGGKTRLTSDAAFEAIGTWTPRGDRITYASVHNRIFDVVSKPAGGTGQAEGLMSTRFPQVTSA